MGRRETGNWKLKPAAAFQNVKWRRSRRSSWSSSWELGQPMAVVHNFRLTCCSLGNFVFYAFLCFPFKLPSTCGAHGAYECSCLPSKFAWPCSTRKSPLHTTSQRLRLPAKHMQIRVFVCATITEPSLRLGP